MTAALAKLPPSDAISRAEAQMSAIAPDRILPRVTDMNRAIALAQLRRAAAMAGWGPGWSLERGGQAR